MQLQRAAILITVVILVSIGLIMIYNSSAVLAGEKAEHMNDPMYFLKRQLVWMSLGIVALLVVSNILDFCFRPMLLLMLMRTAIPKKFIRRFDPP